MKQATILATLLVIAFEGCALESRSHVDEGRSRYRAQVPVHFSLKDIEGRYVSNADYAGRVVLVDVWATWCRPCSESLPYYGELQRRYHDQGLRVVGVSVDEKSDHVRDFVRPYQLPFRVLWDPEGTLAESAGLTSMPSMLLLGKNGEVLYRHDGFVPKDRDAIEAAVKSALATRDRAG